MNKYILAACVLFAMSCEKKTEVSTSPAQEQTSDTRAIDTRDNEIGSLKKVIAEQNAQIESESNASNSEAQVEEPSQSDEEDGKLRDLSGNHSLTLQWISWDNPGKISFKKIGKNLYSVDGKQQIKKEFVTVKGKVEMISPTQLEFDGTIITDTSINGHCEKKGKQTFLSTQNRKYWRLQNMQNCDGAVDYVDIYF